MAQLTLKSLEKRIEALEKSLSQVVHGQSSAGDWKDWRKAVANVKRTELAEEVDAAAREIREADRRQAQS
jgi:hypothetical protein